MNTIVYIALSILFFGCTFACGYCCAMTKVCKNMKEILEDNFIIYFNQMQNAYNADIGSPLEKTLWGLLLVVGVDLTTVKTHDQKGEIGRYE